MNHAVDVIVETDENTEFRNGLDLPLDPVADRMVVGEDLPRILLGLFEAKGDPALRQVDAEHHHLDLLRGRHDLAGIDVLLGPGHLGLVDKSLDTLIEFDEGTVFGDVGHRAGVP